MGRDFKDAEQHRKVIRDILSQNATLEMLKEYHKVATKMKDPPKTFQGMFSLGDGRVTQARVKFKQYIQILEDLIKKKS